MAGTLQTRTLPARSNGTTYSLNIYLPPGIAAIRASVPVIYLLDGDSRFAAVVDIVERTQARVVIVGIGNEALRGRDYVPANICTPGGGGQGAYLDFIRLDLIPFVETTFGGDPQRRILLGHSHGGSFVLYALFNEAPAGRHFAAYLASDASIDCMSGDRLRLGVGLRRRQPLAGGAAAHLVFREHGQRGLRAAGAGPGLRRAGDGGPVLCRRPHRHDPRRLQRRDRVRAGLSRISCRARGSRAPA